MYVHQGVEKTTLKVKIAGRQVSKLELLSDCRPYFHHKLYYEISKDFLKDYSIISPQDTDFFKVAKAFSKQGALKQLNLSPKESRAIGAFVGLSIGDALGSSTEFEDYQKVRKVPFVVKGFQDIEEMIKKQKLVARFGQTRIWTDDCSMALCIADSLLLNKFEFNPVHVRYMFTLWLKHGLNNGGRQQSIGLGGNISLSMGQFMDKQQDYTPKGTQRNSGNGSLMRLAPIATAFYQSKEDAMKYAELQSYTTHNGLEAAECSRLLAGLIVTLINRKQVDKWQEDMNKFFQYFQTKCQSVRFLALSRMQTQQLYDDQISRLEGKDREFFIFFNNSVKDRNWNWKDKNFDYSPRRIDLNLGYIGSYCMDALAMALHMVWYKKCFKDCAIWGANMGGDCDTVGAIACQISGAIYGFNEQMLNLYSQMSDFKYKKYTVLTKAYKLAKGKSNKIAYASN